MIITRYDYHTCPKVIGSNLPVGGPGRLPPRVREEKALLYMSFHLPCSLSRSTVRSTGPPTASNSFADASAFCRSSILAARPLLSPETALYIWLTHICQSTTKLDHSKNTRTTTARLHASKFNFTFYISKSVQYCIYISNEEN